jgi:hypothetical protein
MSGRTYRVQVTSVCKRPDSNSLPLSAVAPSSAPPGIRTHVLMIRSEASLTKGLASRLKLFGSRQASLHGCLEYIFILVLHMGLGTEKCHLLLDGASEFASVMPNCDLYTDRRRGSMSGKTYHRGHQCRRPDHKGLPFPLLHHFLSYKVHI